jgi:hypothetical protein
MVAYEAELKSPSPLFQRGRIFNERFLTAL